MYIERQRRFPAKVPEKETLHRASQYESAKLFRARVRLRQRLHNFRKQTYTLLIPTHMRI